MQKTNSEHIECQIFSKYLKSINALYTKVANEIRTPSIKQIMFQKSEGMNWWCPDYIIIIRCKSWKRKIVFIEMKRKNWWVVSAKQKIRINSLLECWINATISKWAIEAIKYIQNIILYN